MAEPYLLCTFSPYKNVIKYCIQDSQRIEVLYKDGFGVSKVQEGILNMPYAF